MKNRDVVWARAGSAFLVIMAGLCLAAGGGSTAGAQTLRQKPLAKVAATAAPSVSVSSADFQAIAAGIFSGAAYRANSCGGADAVRSTKIVIPGLYDKSEPVGRLDAALPSKVLQETMREEISYSDHPPVIRDSKIRACLDSLGTHPWLGSIENGKFKIRMQFNSNLFIKTRKMHQENKGKGWKDKFEWRDDITDRNVPDYFYVALCLEAFLTPAVQGGHLGYSTVDVRWFWAKDNGFVWPEGALVSDPFRVPYGHPVEKEMILSYKTGVMNAMKQRLVTVFQDNAVRSRLTAALTAKVKTGEFANRTVASVSGAGATVKVAFQ